jgi:hypothetical protein
MVIERLGAPQALTKSSRSSIWPEIGLTLEPIPADLNCVSLAGLIDVVV